jgi:hypothetical protein
LANHYHSPPLIRKIFSADMRLFFKGTPPHQRDTVFRKGFDELSGGFGKAVWPLSASSFGPTH